MSNNDYTRRHPGDKTNLDLPLENKTNSYISIKNDPFGNQTVIYGDDNEENHFIHNEYVDGSVSTNSYDSDESRKSLHASIVAGNKAEYVGGGQVSTTDGPKNDNNLAPNKSASYREVGDETRDYRLLANGRGKVEVTGPVAQVIQQGSQNNKEKVTSGNDNEKVAGSRNFSVEGDSFHSTGESRYDIVKNGEYGIHVQSGNMDVQLDSGKARISTAQEILLICGTSYVKILPNRIEIVADRIDLNP